VQGLNPVASRLPERRSEQGCASYPEAPGSRTLRAPEQPIEIAPVPATKKLADDALSRIRENFDFADTDANGLLDFAEFSSLLRVLAPDCTIQQTAEGFSMVDTNSDGQIDYDEFLAWWRRVWWEF
jgi:calmodulin